MHFTCLRALSETPNLFVEQISRPWRGQPVEVKLNFHVDYTLERFEVSEPLSSILGIKVESKPRLINCLWQYIKSQSLQVA